ncbi:MAG: hypothetical protein ACREBE_18325, partial [bacterium]
MSARHLHVGLAAAVALFAPRLAAAEPDLQLHRAPPRLKMRPAGTPATNRDAAPSFVCADGSDPAGRPDGTGDATVRARGADTALATCAVAARAKRAGGDDARRVASADGRDAAADAPANAEGTADAAAGSAEPAVSAFTPLPRSTRELAERVTFRLRAGVELDAAPASGDALRGGAALPPGFADSRPWIVGDAMVGARDLLLPSLGGYLLSSFQFDASDTLATRTALVTPGDAADQRIAIKAGYVEWGNDDRRPQKLWLRGGRQFRLDAGAMFAYFDGATAGYRDKGVELSGFVGRRVVLYVDSPAGTEFGATAAVDLMT